MTYSIPEEHLARPHYRMRASGKTRFHESMDNSWDREREAWIQQALCPWNRRDREGVHPLVSALAKLNSDLGKPKPKPGSMPTWWNDIYKSDTEEDWIKKETEGNLKSVEGSKTVFYACLDHVDWKDWTSNDVHEVLRKIHLFQYGNKRHDIMRAMMGRGLPLHLLKHNTYPITPAMWSLLNVSHYDDIHFWMDQAYPLDPPGNTPGVINALVYSAPYTGQSQDLVLISEKLMAKGADLSRPVCTTDWYLPDKTDTDRLISRHRNDFYLSPSTLAGQLQALNNSDLLSAIVRHPGVSDKARIESVRIIIEQYGKKKTSAEAKHDDSRDPAKSLWEMLNYAPTKRSAWQDQGKVLIEKFLEHVWASENYYESPLAQKCWHALNTFTQGEKRKSNPENIKPAIDNIVRNTPPKYIQKALSPGGVLGELAVRPDHIVPLAVKTLVNTAMGSSWDIKHDKIRGMLSVLFTQSDISTDAVTLEITQAIMEQSSGSIPLPQLSFLVDTLEKGGWTPHQEGWKILHQRIRESQNDCVEVIEFLSRVMKKHNIPLDQGQYLIPPLHLLPAPSNPISNHAATTDRVRDKGYSQQHEWSYSSSIVAYATFAQCALDCVEDPHLLPWKTQSKNTLLQGIAEAMHIGAAKGSPKHTKEHQALLENVVSSLLEKGLDPLKEPIHPENEAPNWIEGLERGHPFLNTWSDLVARQLKQSTSPAVSKPRTRRF